MEKKNSKNIQKYQEGKIQENGKKCWPEYSKALEISTPEPLCAKMGSL